MDIIPPPAPVSQPPCRKLNLMNTYWATGSPANRRARSTLTMHETHLPNTETTTIAVKLPLVAIEHYMLADDRAEYPMAFYIRLVLDRLPDREALSRGVATALARHPLLVATVDAPQGKRRNWSWEQSTRPEILWPGDAPNEAPLDLSRQTGLRIKAELTADGALLTFEFHHACCDGLGALNFIHEVLKAYAVEENREAPAAPSQSLDPAIKRLSARGRFGVGPLRFLIRLPLELLGFLGVLEFLWHRPAALVGSIKCQPSLALRARVDSAETHWPRRYAHEFTEQETKALRSAASTAGATVNDLLVRDLFLTVGQWIDEHAPSKRGAHIRVMVPVNLRTDDDGDLSAANVVAMINLDRRPRRWHNHRRMLRVLHWEMAAVKWARLGLTFIRAIQVTHYVLGKLQLLLAADKCQATCVLSNLGDPWRKSPLMNSAGRFVAGDVTLQQVEILPPIRPLTSLSAGAMSISGRLTVTFHCDRNVLTDEEAKKLLRRYVERLRESMVS